MQDRDHSVDAVGLTYDVGHLTESEADTSLEGDLRVSNSRGESGQNDVADFFGGEVLKTLAQAGNGCVLDLRLVVVEEQVEGLDKIVVCDISAESLSKLGKVAGKREAHLP